MSYAYEVFSQTKHLEIVGILIIIIPLVFIKHLLSEISGISTVAKTLFFSLTFILKTCRTLEISQSVFLSSKT